MSLIKYKYKSDRDSDGTPNCGQEDALFIAEYNNGLYVAEQIYEKELEKLRTKNKELEDWKSEVLYYIPHIDKKVESSKKEIESLRTQVSELEKATDGYRYRGVEDRLRKELEALRAQLKDAENVIDYYAVEACNEDWCERYLPEPDREIMDYLSGKRAREYQANYKRVLG